MSMDGLQSSIRKMKNPSVLDLTIPWEGLPPAVREGKGQSAAYGMYCRELLDGLKEIIPAVRIPFAIFALMDGDGMAEWKATMEAASGCGYYTLLEAPEIFGPIGADWIAKKTLGADAFSCDGVILSPYLGSDAVRPFLSYCARGKSIFILARSGNKTAGEIQDLRSGSRLVHGAAAEMAGRHGQGLYGKCGYSQVGIVASAGAEEATRALRKQYDRMFLLLDSMDYSSANAKKCAAAFDRFGYGAAVCAGTSITCAWREENDADYMAAAVRAAERMKRNLTNYVTIL